MDYNEPWWKWQVDKKMKGMIINSNGMKIKPKWDAIEECIKLNA